MQYLSTASIALVAMSAWWYLQRARGRAYASAPSVTGFLKREGKAEVISLTWSERYAWLCAVALLISGGLAPITLQGWHVTVALHAACIPFGFWIVEMDARYAHVRRYFLSFLLLGVALVVVVGFGKPSFRKVALPAELHKYPSVLPLFPMGKAYEK
jgi:hypothetical protein